MSSGNTSLLDLVAAGYIQVGEKVVCKDTEGVVTDRGTIRVDEEATEYNTPTAFSKAVTKSTSGGWQQVKLGSDGTTSLYDVKLKHDGAKGKRKSKKKFRVERRRVERKEKTGSLGPMRRSRTHTTMPKSVMFPLEFQAAMSNITLPILVRFRDDDTKRGSIIRVSEDFVTFDLEYKGKLYKSVSSASREMYREYAAETGEVVAINSNGFEDLKYQTPRGEWCKLRELFPVEIRKKSNSFADSTISQPIKYQRDEYTRMENDYDLFEAIHVLVDASVSVPHSDSDSDTDTATTPPASPPATPPIYSPLHSPRNQDQPASKRITPLKTNPNSPPAVLHTSPPPSTPTTPRQYVKDVELLIHVDAADAIPYYITGRVCSYEDLRKLIAKQIPEFPIREPHEMGVYSEFWHNHSGIAYVKAPRDWADFPKCTSVLLKKTPEEILLKYA